MFNIFKKKADKLLIKAPVDGDVVEIVDVPDEVFAQKLIGDGVAVIPEADIFVSTVDGIVTAVFPTKHAIGIRTKEGIEVMIHVGIDTVKLNGEGFVTFVTEGDKVKVGDKLLKIERTLIKSKAKSLVSPIVVTNMDRIKEFKKMTGKATAGQTVVIEAVI
ncbi:PTS system IIA component, Glc family [Thermoanaerobacter thermohydrosulfuricus]|nr:PTS system IIA component, Glc family [Thermoanaerobacter thermohydrosulfuricus]